MKGLYPTDVVLQVTVLLQVLNPVVLVFVSFFFVVVIFTVAGVTVVAVVLLLQGSLGAGVPGGQVASSPLPLFQISVQARGTLKDAEKEPFFHHYGRP